jgi:hypothetical protein
VWWCGQCYRDEGVNGGHRRGLGELFRRSTPGWSSSLQRSSRRVSWGASAMFWWLSLAVVVAAHSVVSGVHPIAIGLLVLCVSVDRSIGFVLYYAVIY